MFHYYVTDKYGIPKKYIEGCEDQKKKDSSTKKEEKNPKKWKLELNLF